MRGPAVAAILTAVVLLAACGRAPGSSAAGPASTTAARATTAAVTVAGTGTSSGLGPSGPTTVPTRHDPPTRTTVIKRTAAVTTTAKKAAATTARKKQLYDRKTSEIGFGYYGMSPDYLEMDTDAVAYMKSDHANTFLLSASPDELVYGLQQCQAYNSKAWVGLGDVFGSDKRLKEDWQATVDAVVAQAKGSGAYEALLGFYLDEPLLNGCKREDIFTLTKYNHDTIGKRFFICFAVAGVAPEVYADPNCSPPLTPETGRYITDIACDMYSDYDLNQDRYDRTMDLMLQRAGNDQVRVWYIPRAFIDKTDDTDEIKRFNEQCIRHIQGLYGRLQREKNPGGLMVFLYDGHALDFIGLRQAGEGLWRGLKQTCERIGREICTGNMG